MLRILRQILRTGIVTEPLPPYEGDIEITERGLENIKGVNGLFKRSCTIRMVDPGSCNGCELELYAINNAVYNCEHFGIHFTASPRFADILLVTGPVSRNMEIALLRTYEAAPPPKLVVAVGDCAYDGGVFGKSYASVGGVGEVIPVDVYVKGCPPPPWTIIHGILKAMRGDGSPP